jgi:hypothetical protein
LEHANSFPLAKRLSSRQKGGEGEGIPVMAPLLLQVFHDQKRYEKDWNVEAQQGDLE